MYVLVSVLMSLLFYGFVDRWADCSTLPFMLSYTDARGECFPYFQLLLLGIYPPCTPFALISEVCTEQTVQVFQNVLYRLGVSEYGYCIDNDILDPIYRFL